VCPARAITTRMHAIVGLMQTLGPAQLRFLSVLKVQRRGGEGQRCSNSLVLTACVRKIFFEYIVHISRKKHENHENHVSTCQKITHNIHRTRRPACFITCGRLARVSP
jgi:hypothetical protein